MLGVISPADIDRTWSLCAPMLKKAVRKENPYTLEEYKQGLKDGTFQLWTWVENNKIICCGITTILTFPSKKICSMPIVGGTYLKIWKEESQRIIAEWAKRNGCAIIEGYASRKGWLRVLPNWKPVWITIHRSL